jgi:hypothetical protein
MFTNILKVGILAMFCLVTACTPYSKVKSEPSESSELSVGRQNDLIKKSRQRYPSSLYLIGIGQGESAKAATELARADLIKQIRVEVRVTWSDFIRERGGTTEQEVSRLVETKVGELVRGIEIVDQATEAGTSYAVAALPKTEISRILERGNAQPETLSTPLEPSELKEGIWVQAEGVVSLGEDTTVAEAKARSRDEARRKAIEKAVGTFVRSRTIVYNAQVAEDLVHSLVRGIVVEEQILEEGVRQLGQETGTTALLYATKLKAKVKPVRAERKGDFRVKAALNKTVFQEGEEMQITAATTKAAHFHIFNIGQDDTVTVLLPNRFISSNAVQAQQELIFPDESQRTMGIRLRVFPPQGERKAMEKIKVIATTKQIDLMKGKVREGVYQVYAGKDAALVTELLKELSLLDEAEWAEMTVPYEVRK